MARLTLRFLRENRRKPEMGVRGVGGSSGGLGSVLIEEGISGFVFVFVCDIEGIVNVGLSLSVLVLLLFLVLFFFLS